MAIIDRRGVSVDATATPIAGDPNPGLAVKAPCLVATTANIALTGLQTIDGVTLAEGNRVLVWQQTDATTNGLYNASSGVWTRTIDANSNDQLASGMQVVVTSGASNAEQQFTLTAPDPVILGTSPLGFLNIMDAAVAAATGEIYAVLYGVNTARPDNSAVLQTAVNAAVAAGYKTVVLPAGTIKLSSAVFLNSWTPPGALTVPGLKIRGQGKGVTIINTSVANGFAFAVNPAWRGAHKSLFLASAATVGGTLSTNTWYVQITVTTSAGDEVFVTQPKSFSVTGPTGKITLPLQDLASPGYSYNIYCDTVNPPAHYASLGGTDAVRVAGGQTVQITAAGSAHAVPVTKIACWQEAEIADLTITSSSGTANASGILYFKAGYADISNVECLSLKGDGVQCQGYTGDSDGSFNVRILKSKFDTIAAWGVNAAGGALELSNFLVEDTEFNLCGTAPANLGTAVTIAGITNSAAPVVSFNVPHNLLAGDQWNYSGGAGMTLPAGWYRVGEAVAAQSFNLVDLNGAAVSTSALGAYTANSGTAALAWRPPRWNAATGSTNGSGGIAWLGLIGTFRNLDFTQCNNVDIYVSENGASDNATFEGIDLENTAGKGVYIGGLLGGSWNGGEVLSTAGLGNTIAGFQFGTGFPGGGVNGFTLDNLKVRNNVTPAHLFEQFPNTNIGASFVDTVRIGPHIAYQFFSLAGQVRFVGFNFPPIEGQCQFQITGTDVAKLSSIGYGNTMPLHLGSSNGDGEWVAYQVPAAGITLNIAGPQAPFTQYYFYLYNSAAEGTPWTGTINAPTTTAPVVASTGGYKVRADDPTQIYIGTWTTDGSGHFNVGFAGSSWYPAGASGVVVNAGSPNGVAYFVASNSVGSTLAGTDGQLLLGKTLAGPAFATMSGDATISNTGAVTIAGHAVSNAKFRQGAALSVVGVTGNATADVADIAAASDNTVLRRSGSAVGFGSLDLSQANTVGATILGKANGGTGNASLTAHGVVLGNGSGALTTVNGTAGNSSLPLISQGASLDPIYSTLGNVALANSTISGVSLGSNLFTLTFGTHLLAGGSSYNGSAAVTISNDATNANTASTMVARDASGNFSAGTITASLTGHASLDLALTGGTMSGAIAMGSNAITGLTTLAASGALTFQSNGSTYFGQATTGQQVQLGPNQVTPLTGPILTISRNTVTPPAGVGTNQNLLNLVGADATSADIQIQTFAAAANAAVRYFRARGTAASPTAAQSGDVLGANFGYGYYTSGGPAYYQAGGFAFTATDNYTSTTSGMRVDIYATPTGTAAIAVGASVGAGFMVGGTSDPGAGNIVATGKIRPGSFTVATLPASPSAGDTVFCSNVRVFNGAGVQEGAGVGTGGLVSYNGTAWKIEGTNVTAVA